MREGGKEKAKKKKKEADEVRRSLFPRKETP
jgi:hypothetical protein